MPLDKVLLKHVEDVDKIEDEVGEYIDSMLLAIDMSALIANPQETLSQFVDEVQDMLKEDHYPEIAKKGIELAREIEQDGDIDIQRTDDPTINKDQVDGV